MRRGAQLALSVVAAAAARGEADRDALGEAGCVELVVWALREARPDAHDRRGRAAGGAGAGGGVRGGWLEAGCLAARRLCQVSREGAT